MSVALKLEGLTDLRASLLALPDKLRAQANDEVKRTTKEAAAALVVAYPQGDTGNLRKGVRTRYRINRLGLGVGTVLSLAPHAHLWEFGTVNRTTQKGWNRGRMVAQYNRGLVGIAARERREMMAALIALVRNTGFEVTHAG